MPTLIRGYSDDIQNLNSEPILGTERDELLSDTLHRIAQHIDSPVRIMASAPPDEYLLFGPSQVEAGDGATKTAPPVDGVLTAFAGGTIGFQSKTATGTILIDGSSFSFPASTVGYFRRLASSLLGDGTVSARWSSEVANIVNLDNPGNLFATLDGLRVGYIDLECTDVSGKFKTAGSTSDVIENMAGSDSRIYRFEIGGERSGGSEDQSFQFRRVVGDTLIVKKGYIRLSDGRELYSPTDLSRDLSGIIDDGNYYGYIDSFSLGVPQIVDGRKLYVVTDTTIIFDTTTADLHDQVRFIYLGTVKRAAGVWSSPQSAASKFHETYIDGNNLLEFSTDYADIGSLGSVNQLLAGHILTAESFPSAATTSFFNLSGNSLDNGAGGKNLTNSNVLFTAVSLFGVADAASFNGTTALLNSADAFFNPAGNFTCGGWFNPTSWTGTAQLLFGQWGPAKRSFAIAVDAAGLLWIKGSVGGSAEQSVQSSWVATSGRHHIALRYTAASYTLDLLVDGNKEDSLVLSGARYVPTPTLGFVIGYDESTAGSYFAGSLDEFFFCSNATFTDNELSKVLATKVTHGRNMAPVTQGWSATVKYGDTERSLENFTIDMDENALYANISGQQSAAKISFALQSKGLIGATAPIKSFARVRTAAEIDTEINTTLAHNLPAIPTSGSLLVQNLGGNFVSQDWGMFFEVDSSLITRSSSLATAFGAGTQVIFVLSVGAASVYVSGGSSGGLTPVYVDSNFAFEHGMNYMVNTSSAALVATLGVGLSTFSQTAFKPDSNFTVNKFTVTPDSGVKIYDPYTDTTIVGPDRFVMDINASGQFDWDFPNTRWVLSLGGFVGMVNTMSDLIVNRLTVNNRATGNGLIPPGIISQYGGVTAPAYWLDCDGSVKNRADYPDLFASIGTVWDTCTNPLTKVAYSAPLVTQFRLPDLRGTFTRGEGGSVTLAGFQDEATANNGLGLTGNIAHNLHVVDPGHNHDFLLANAGSNANLTVGSSGNSSPVNPTHTIASISTGSTGISLDGDVNNGTLDTTSSDSETRPHNVGVKYIIKT